MRPNGWFPNGWFPKGWWADGYWPAAGSSSFYSGEVISLDSKISMLVQFNAAITTVVSYAAPIVRDVAGSSAIEMTADEVILGSRISRETVIASEMQREGT